MAPVNPAGPLPPSALRYGRLHASDPGRDHQRERRPPRASRPGRTAGGVLVVDDRARRGLGRHRGERCHPGVVVLRGDENAAAQRCLAQRAVIHRVSEAVAPAELSEANAIVRLPPSRYNI